jgi:hypothetical protein
MLHYRLWIETVAVHQQATRRVAMTIPSGTVLKVLNADKDANGFVEVEWDGESVQIFAIDLRDRGELIGSHEGVLARAKAAASCHGN